MIASFEHTEEDPVRYQWEEGMIDPDNRHPQCLDDIWKEWRETCMWYNT